MLAKWARDSRLHLLIILAVYAVAAAVMQVQCADLLTSDGQNYLRMAVYYVQGDWDHAIFGHWSPLGAWMTVPLVAVGMVPRYAFRLMIGLWGALAVAGAWRLAGRFGMGSWLRAAATVCAAALVVEFSADHRVDLLLTALLLFYLDAAMHERLLEGRGWAHLAGVLAGMAYLAKLYALPFFVAHFTLVVLLRGIVGKVDRQEAPSAEQSAITNPQSQMAAPGFTRRLFLMGRAWLAGLIGFALIAAPWVGVLSARLGRLTFGTAGATSYALVGPGSGDARRRMITGLRKPPADAYNVWQDATQDVARPADGAPSPLSSVGAAVRQLRVVGENVVRIGEHLASVDEFRLALGALALTPLALLVSVRRREARFRYAALLATVGVFCGGYALVQAANARYFWFVFLVLLVAAFHYVGAVTGGLARWAPRLKSGARLLAVAGGVAAVVSFGYHPVRFAGTVLSHPPLGREHRVVAERLRELGVDGPLAAVGERGWWDGLHTAYYLDAKYAGAPKATAPVRIVAEMRGAEVQTLLVWGRPALAAALGAKAGVERVGVIPSADVAGLEADVVVLRVREQPPAAE